MSSSDSNELMFNLSSSSDSDNQEKKEAPKEEKELEMVKTLGDPRELEDELAKMSMEEIRKNLARQEGEARERVARAIQEKEAQTEEQRRLEAEYETDVETTSFGSTSLGSTHSGGSSHRPPSRTVSDGALGKEINSEVYPRILCWF